jgi:hypothetical protein
MHCGEAGNGNRIEPREDIGREGLVEGHARKSVPEESERLGALHLLPMKPLKRFDHGKSTPVDCIDVPDSNGAQHPGNTVAKEPNRDDSQDDSDRAQRQVVVEFLCCEHGTSGSTVGGGSGRDGADCMLFQIPRPMIEKGHDGDPSGNFALPPFPPPSSLESIPTGEPVGPRIAEEVSNENDERPLDGYKSWFELDED